MRLIDSKPTFSVPPPDWHVGGGFEPQTARRNVSWTSAVGKPRSVSIDESYRAAAIMARSISRLDGVQTCALSRAS
jgi:hypothetical protein